KPPASSAEKQIARWHRARMFSFIVLAFFAMFLFPAGQQVRPVRQKSHDAINVLFGDGLQDDAAELVLQKLNPGAGFDLMLAAKRSWNHKLALGCERRTYVFHVLQYIIGKTLIRNI